MIATRRRRSVPRSSPFAALRGLPLVGHQLVEQSDEVDDLEIEFELDRLFPAVPMPTGHAAERYFEHSQNDGAVILFKAERDTVQLSFGHYDMVRLANVFIDKRWWDLRHMFPTALNFDGVTELIVMRHVEQGIYQRIRGPVHAYDIGRIWATGVSNSGLDIVINLRSGVKGFGYSRRKKPPASWFIDDYYIFLTCRNLTVEENLREQWSQMFGTHYLDVFDQFQSVWPVPLWGVDEFEAFAEEHSGQAPISSSV